MGLISFQQYGIMRTISIESDFNNIMTLLIINEDSMIIPIINISSSTFRDNLLKIIFGV